MSEEDYKLGYRDGIVAGEVDRAAIIEECAREVQRQIEFMADFNSSIMSDWDEIRKQCETYKGSDLPRLNFESLIETIAERAAAALRNMKDGDKP